MEGFIEGADCLNAVIQKFDYVFFQDTLNKTVGATDRSPEQGEACLAPTINLWVGLEKYTTQFMNSCRYCKGERFLTI